MEDNSRKYTRIYLLISSCLLGIALIPAAGLAMFSPMMLDAPGSEESTITVSLVTSLLLWPVTIVLFIALSWVLFYKRKHRWSAVIASIPYLNGLMIVVLFILLSVICDGNFNC